MRSVEVSGKTLEEAKQAAAQQLGVREEDMRVELLEEPRRVLGLWGAGEFRIRATAVEAQMAVPETVRGMEEVGEAEQPETEAGASEGAPTATQAERAEPKLVKGKTRSECTAEEALAVLREILSLMGVQARASVRGITHDEVTIELSGPQAGQLIGHHGSVLNALQLLVAVIVNRDGAGRARIILDAEGYRERRRRMLERMAHAHAARARQAGKELVITDLLPYERRIIHLALKDDPDVQTYSEGEGDNRRLVISPRT